MKLRRMAVIAVAASLFVSTATIVLAEGHDTETDGETRELSDAQYRKAQLLADYMTGDDAEAPADDGVPDVGDSDEITPLDEIIALRTGDTVVGWGAMFKLLQLSKATGTSLADLLAEFDGEDGWAFGRRFKELDDPQKALLDDAPKNLGQLMKQQREPKENRGKNSGGG